MLATLIFGCFLFSYLSWFIQLFHGPVTGNYNHGSPDFAKLHPELPLVFSSGIQFLEADHYEPPEVVRRLYYLTNRKAALEYTGSDVFEGFRNIHRWFPIRAKVAEYDRFITQQQHFIVYGPYAYPNDWLIRKLVNDGILIRFLDQYPGQWGDNLLLEVQADSVNPSKSPVP
jgi:hypothetical protein